MEATAAAVTAATVAVAVTAAKEVADTAINALLANREERAVKS